MTELSNRQKKIQSRKAASDAFVLARRQAIMAQFENNLKLGERFFEENKENMTEQDIAFIEAEKAKNEKYVAELKEKWGLNSELVSEEV